MFSRSFRTCLTGCAAAVLTTLAGCGGGSGESGKPTESVAIVLDTTAETAPVPSLAFSGTEDTALHGTLNPDGRSGEFVAFTVVVPPAHGSLIVDAVTGEFTYAPDSDYNGTDSFVYRSENLRKPLPGRSATITLAAVNDAPTLAPIADMTNSAETRDTVLSLQTQDVDGDALHIVASSDDPAVAAVTADDSTHSITISPDARGTTRIHVSVSDGQLTAQRDFAFTVGDVTKYRTIPTSLTDGEVITFTNTTDQPITMTFAHNGFPLFQSDEEIVRFVDNMPPQYEGEPFERKLWRFVRDSTYHNVPLNKDQWLHDAWAVIGSEGWGFCSHVSAAFVQLARAAGYEARVWGLTGHVVPEIKIDGRWEVFDPDLALYYFTPQEKPAGVADLVADPSLVTSPIDPILPVTGTVEYSNFLAGIYGSTNDNYIGNDVFLTKSPGQYQPLVLPPGSRFTYPGRWTPTVTGIAGDVPTDIPYYLQGQLLTRATWTGRVVLPWMLWEIRGTGRVRILDHEYDIGSPELIAFLNDPGGQIPELEVLSATTDLRFVYFINAMKYALASTNKVELTGRDVWGIQVGTRLLANESRASPTGVIQYKKPAY